MTDFYADLGVKRDASAAEIKAAHRKRAKETHPDTHPDRRAEFEKVQKAYSNLRDPDKRHYYDNHGKEKDDTPQDVAMVIIAQMFDSMLGQDLPSDFDYISGIKAAVNNTIAEAMGRKVMFERRIRRFEKLQKKIRLKKRKGANFFVLALELKILDLKDKIPRAEEVIKNSKEALEILDQYEFDQEVNNEQAFPV